MTHVNDKSKYDNDDLEEGELRDTEDEDDSGIHRDTEGEDESSTNMDEKIPEDTSNNLEKEQMHPVSGYFSTPIRI